MNVIIKAIVSKLMWIGIGIFLTLFLLATLCKQKPQTVTFYSTDTLTEYVYKDTSIIADTVVLSLTDTLFVDSSTTMGEIPIRTHVQDYIRALISGKNRWEQKHTVETDYRGTILAQRMISENDTFTVEVPSESALRLCGSVGLGYLNQGSIYAPAKIGLLFKKRVSFSAVAGHLNGWYVGGLLEAHF